MAINIQIKQEEKWRNVKGPSEPHPMRTWAVLRTKASWLGCINVQKVLKIMIPPPQPIILVPKVSLIEKFKKKFDTRGSTKRAEVYLYSLCSEHPTKWSLCFKNRACNAWYDSKSWSDPLSSLFWSQRVHQMKFFLKIWC